MLMIMIHHYNRKVKHKNAPKIHGGVGMLIKKDLYLKYNIFQLIIM